MNSKIWLKSIRKVLNFVNLRKIYPTGRASIMNILKLPKKDYLFKDDNLVLKKNI